MARMYHPRLSPAVATVDAADVAKYEAWGWLTLAEGQNPPARPGADGAAAPVGGLVLPSDLNLLAWTFDPMSHTGQTSQLANGELLGVLMNIPAGTLHALSYRVWVAGVAVATAEVGLIDATTGNRIAVATGLAASMNTNGQVRAPFTQAAEWAGGLAYAVVLITGSTTAPRLASLTAGDTSMLNTRGQNVGNLIRCGRISGTTGLTTIQPTYDLGGNSPQNRPFYFAVD